MFSNKLSRLSVLVLGVIMSLLSAASPVHASFTLVRDTGHFCSTAATSCSVTVTALGAGHLVYVAGAESTNTVSLSSVTATGETFTVDSGCRNAGDSTTGGTDCAYTLSAVGGATTVTCNWSASTAGTCYVKEFPFTNSPASKDASSSIFDSSACGSCPGVALTLTGTNDVIMQAAACGDTCTAISSPYTGTFNVGDGNGYAHSLNTTSGTAPTWTQTSSARLAGHAIAFKESAGAPSCNNFIALLGAGCK